MALSVCSDVWPASRIVASDQPWERLVTFGPAGLRDLRAGALHLRSHPREATGA